MWLVLGTARYCMVELEECLFYVEENVEVDLAALIIPGEVNSEVALSFPIIGDVVMLLENGHEMLCMLFADVFYSNFFNAKRESDWASGVCP